MQLKKAFVGVTLALASAAASAGPFSGIYFFGDSLTDMGAFGGLDGLPAGAHWTFNSQPTYAYYLGNTLGFTVTPNNPNNGTLPYGGNDFAQGGARSTTSGNTFAGVPITDLPGQIDTYLKETGGISDSSGLYVVWSGSNDVANATSASAITTAVTSEIDSLADLRLTGAHNVVLVDLPDFSVTPAVLYGTLASVANTIYGSGTTAAANATAAAVSAAYTALSTATTPNAAARQAAYVAAEIAAANAMGVPASVVEAAYAEAAADESALSTGYNAGLNSNIPILGLNIIHVNTNAVLDAIIDNPNAFGITNTSGGICPPSTNAAVGTASSILCTASTTNLSALNTYLFSDDRHPSPLVQQLLAGYITSLLAAPYNTVALLDAQRMTVLNQGDVLDRLAGSTYVPPGGHVFAEGGFSSARTSSTEGLGGADDTGGSATIGYELPISGPFSIGGAVSFERYDANLNAGYGNFNGQGELFALYGLWHQGGLKIRADIYGGTQSYNLQRNVIAGTDAIVNSASPNGNETGARLSAAYEFRLASSFVTGPFASLSQTHSHLGDVDESGLSGTTLQIQGWTESVLDAQLGWKISRPDWFLNLTPSASLSYHDVWRSWPSNVVVGQAYYDSDFLMPLSKPREDYAEAGFGVTGKIAKNWSLSANAQFSFANANERYSLVSLNLLGKF
jgi:outer membrane lipase/esterase